MDERSIKNELRAYIKEEQGEQHRILIEKIDAVNSSVSSLIGGLIIDVRVLSKTVENIAKKQDDFSEHQIKANNSIAIHSIDIALLKQSIGLGKKQTDNISSKLWDFIRIILVAVLAAILANIGLTLQK